MLFRRFISANWVLKEAADCALRTEWTAYWAAIQAEAAAVAGFAMGRFIVGPGLAWRQVLSLLYLWGVLSVVVVVVTLVAVVVVVEHAKHTICLRPSSKSVWNAVDCRLSTCFLQLCSFFPHPLSLLPLHYGDWENGPVNMSTNKSSCKNGILNCFWHLYGGCQWKWNAHKKISNRLRLNSTRCDSLNTARRQQLVVIAEYRHYQCQCHYQYYHYIASGIWASWHTDSYGLSIVAYYTMHIK